MVGRAAGNYIHLLDIFHILVRESDAFKAYISICKNRIDSILYHLWLFVYFFEHKMLISAFFCSFCVPLDSFHFFLYLFAIEIVESNCALCKFCKLHIAYIVDISCILKYCRDVRGEVAFAASNAYYHRAVFSCGIYLTGIVLEHNSEGIRATDTDEGMIKSVNRSTQVLFVIIVNKLYGNFCISFRLKGISFFDKLFTKLLIVFDNSVMYGDNIFIVAAMRVGVYS